MRAVLGVFLLLCAALAGCSGSGPDGPAPLGEATGGATTAPLTGAIVGVVVDNAVKPIAEATVALPLPSGREEATTDAMGRFGFDGLPAGSYVLEISKAGYRAVQFTARVDVGVAQPPLAKVRLEPHLVEEPYAELYKLAGFLSCGYASLITNPCVWDYTVLAVAGGFSDETQQLNNLSGNTRDLITQVAPGWQALVFELSWEPSLQGTAEQMGITVSHPERQAGHRYASAISTSPGHLRISAGLPGPGAQNDGSGEDFVPREGRALQTLIDAGPASNGLPGFVINQDFEFFQSNFYYGAPPEGWSFVAGDEPPF